MPPAASVAVRVPGKVNLQLAVGPVRPDGYHDLANLFCALDLHDEVVAERADGLSLQMVGAQLAGVPDDLTNLAARAALLLADRAGLKPDVALRITKRIPVAGGMAGGSADAAGALVACNTVWELGLPQDELLGLAAELGSDVPFALLGGAALGHGRGERLSPVPVGAPLTFVLALAEGGLSTPEVFRTCDALRAGRTVPEPTASPALLDALRVGDLAAVGAHLGNDLQEAALSLRPGLAGVLKAGRAAGALGGVVSGSGPTCAFLVANEEDAARVTAAVGRVDDVRGTAVARGPVPGASVVAA